VINVNQLRVFYIAAKELNFSKAARKLNVTQPAVTAQLKMFEEFCGFKLFRKGGGKLSLTDEGKVLFTRACALFEKQRQLEEAINDLQKCRMGYLRIGTTKTYARRLMPGLLARFHRNYSGIMLELNEGSSLEMLRGLMDYTNTFAITANISSPPDVLFRQLLLEEVVLIVSPNHPWSREKEIQIDQLSSFSIIMKEEGSGTSKLVQDRAAKANVELNVIMQTSNMHFIKEMVKQSDAFSFVVRSSVEREIERGELVVVPIRGEPLMLEIVLAYLSDQELTSPVKAFLDFLTPLFGVIGSPSHLPIGARGLLNRLTNLPLPQHGREITHSSSSYGRAGLTATIP